MGGWTGHRRWQQCIRPHKCLAHWMLLVYWSPIQFIIYDSILIAQINVTFFYLGNVNVCAIGIRLGAIMEWALRAQNKWSIKDNWLSAWNIKITFGWLTKLTQDTGSVLTSYSTLCTMELVWFYDSSYCTVATKRLTLQSQLIGLTSQVLISLYIITTIKTRKRPREKKNCDKCTCSWNKNDNSIDL